MADRRTLARVIGFLGPERARYLSALAALGLTNYGLNLGFALTGAQITASLAGRDQVALGHAMIWLVAVAVAAVAVFYVGGVALVGSAARAEAALRIAVFRKAMAVPLASVRAWASGELFSRMNSDVAKAAALYRQSLQSLAIVAVNGVGSIATALVFDLRVGLVALALSALALLINVPLTRPLDAASRDVQAGEAGMLSAFAQLLQGASIIRYFNLAAWIAGRIGVRTQGLARAGVRLAVLDGLRTSTDTIDYAITIGVVLYGGYRCLHDPAFAPKLIALVQISGGISVLFAQIGGLVADVRIRLAAAARVVELLDLTDEPLRLRAPDGAGPAAPGPGLVLDHVSFTYRDTADVGVRDISLVVRPGQRVALVGPSGSGKTTIVKLVLGLLAPAGGTISIDGLSLYDEDLAAWRRRCAYVPQDYFIFADTLYDNLIAGGADPGLDAVVRAAQLANAHDLIAALPEGYRTPIGERAAQLSGGQRQRIAIARAILQDAVVLLLDEPSSAIDHDNERAIHDALRQVMSDRPTLVIAHRLSTIRDADVIYCIAAGRVAEHGTHATLMATPGGLYRRLVEAEHPTPAGEIDLGVSPPGHDPAV